MNNKSVNVVKISINHEFPLTLAPLWQAINQINYDLLQTS